MKKYIDKETGKIVNEINNQEAIQIIGMYFDYTFGNAKMTGVKMKFLTYLSAYMKKAKKADIEEIVNYLEAKRKDVDLDNNVVSQKYSTLMKLFKLYLDLNSEQIDIVRAYQVIATLETTKENIKKSKTNGGELSPKEAMLAELMENGFEFKSYAPEICKKWEENLKAKIEKGEVEVSLEEEIAYQDLLDFNISDTDLLNKTSNKKQTQRKVEVEQEEKPEVIKEQEKGTEKENIIEIKPVKVKEEIQPIKIEIKDDNTQLDSEQNLKSEEKKIENKKEDIPQIVVTMPEDEEKQIKSKEEKIQPEQLSKKTQEVDLNDSLDFVNKILEDDKKAKKSDTSTNEDDEVTESSGNFSNIFRD